MGSNPLADAASPGPMAALNRCERCRRNMTARIVSFFTEAFICMACLQEEHELLMVLKLAGVDIAALAGCGEVPLYPYGQLRPVPTPARQEPPPAGPLGPGSDRAGAHAG